MNFIIFMNFTILTRLGLNPSPTSPDHISNITIASEIFYFVELSPNCRAEVALIHAPLTSSNLII